MVYFILLLSRSARPSSMGLVASEDAVSNAAFLSSGAGCPALLRVPDRLPVSRDEHVSGSSVSQRGGVSLAMDRTVGHPAVLLPEHVSDDGVAFAGAGVIWQGASGCVLYAADFADMAALLRGILGIGAAECLGAVCRVRRNGLAVISLL
jgi:hypothetical protein